MKNKTSGVEWLVKEISEILGKIQTTPMQDLLLVDAMKQAKEMHREEIEKAYEQGNEDGFYSTESKSDYEIEGRNTYLSNKYYNETYGSTKQD